jgi:hypothetical protein
MAIGNVQEYHAGARFEFVSPYQLDLRGSGVEAELDSP